MLGSKARKKIGEMLIEDGLITQRQLDEALEGQKTSKDKLGQILIKKGAIKEGQLMPVLCRQLRIKRLDGKKFTPIPSMRSLIPEELASKHRLVPLVSKQSLVWVAMLDPTDIAAIDAVEHHTRLEVEPVFCTQKEFDELAHGVYGKKLLAEALVEMPVNMEDIDIEASSDEEDGGEGALNIDSLKNMADDAPVVKIVNSILVQALNKRASDVHISPRQDRISFRLRIDGDLKEFPAPPKKIFLPLVSRIKLLSNLDISVARIPQDGRFTYYAQGREVSVRTSTIPTIYGEKVVLRLHVHGGHTLALDDLGMSDNERVKIEKAILKPHGMILATGPTGSGKTTLLYAILRKVSKPNINIISLEDPVESRLDDVTQVQLNSKAGMTFASGLRSILRQDPDVIMIGEIRDMETAEIGIKAAMTGHKVLSTLHTNDSAGAVTRFVEMGIEPFLISSTLLVAVAQRLVRRICPECIEPYQADDISLRAMNVPLNSRMHFFRGKGCFHCDNSGFKGRLGVYEILEIDNMVQELILRRASAYEIKERAVRANKLRTLKMDAAFKVFEGLTTFEEFTSVAF